MADDLERRTARRRRPGAARRLVGSCDLVCPAPGVPETHAVIDAARRHGVDLVSEIELAYRWEQDRAGGPRPMLAITGTDGKTTTTLLTVEMLRAGGVRTIDAGNTSTPLVDAIDLDLDAFVVECTSFRLAWTPTFRAEAAAWLNLAPDHLNWHTSMASYEAAKAGSSPTNAPTTPRSASSTDPVVVRHLDAVAGPPRDVRARPRRLSALDGRWPRRSSRVRAGRWPTSERCAGRCRTTSPTRWPRRPWCSSRGSSATMRSARRWPAFVGPPHRLEHIADIDGVAWFNDSKATTPHAASAAIRSVRPDRADRRWLRQGGRPVADGGRTRPGRRA